jgi:hypothetical protein
MASHQRALGFLRAAGIDPQTGQKTQQAPPAATPAPATTQPGPAPAPTPQAPPAARPDLETMVEMLFTERVLDRYTSAVDAAVAKFPAVAPFRDRLEGDTPEAILADAEKLNTRLGGAPAAPAPATVPGSAPAAPAATPEPRVAGGAPSAPSPTPTGGEDPAAELRAIFNSRQSPEKKMQDYLAFKAQHPDVTLVPGGTVYSSWDRSGKADQSG